MNTTPVSTWPDLPRWRPVPLIQRDSTPDSCAPASGRPDTTQGSTLPSARGCRGDKCCCCLLPDLYSRCDSGEENSRDWFRDLLLSAHVARNWGNKAWEVCFGGRDGLMRVRLAPQSLQWVTASGSQSTWSFSAQNMRFGSFTTSALKIQNNDNIIKIEYIYIYI